MIYSSTTVQRMYYPATALPIPFQPQSCWILIHSIFQTHRNTHAPHSPAMANRFLRKQLKIHANQIFYYFSHRNHGHGSTMVTSHSHRCTSDTDFPSFLSCTCAGTIRGSLWFGRQEAPCAPVRQATNRPDATVDRRFRFST